MDTQYKIPVETLPSTVLTTSTGLPLSGGTMTGDLTFGSGSGGIFNNVGEISIHGGTNMHLYQGAGLLLCGESYASMTGQFVLRAAINSSTVCDLYGTPSGSLTWGGKEVERVYASGTGYIRYNSGLQICWGDQTLSHNTVTIITLPAAFKDTSYIIANASQHMNSSTIFSVPSTITSLPYTTSSFYLGQVNTASAAMDVQWIAIGQWK